jgi:hypothetical protein
MHTGMIQGKGSPFPFHGVFPGAAFADVFPMDRPHGVRMHRPAPQIGDSIPHKNPLPATSSAIYVPKVFIGRFLTSL